MCSMFADRLAIGARTLATACVLALANAQDSRAEACVLRGPFPEGTALYHVGTYGGTSTLLSFTDLDGSGREAKKVDVLVNLPGKPVVLALTSYDPVIWNIAWTPGSNIVGAVIAGYYGQAILGLPKSIPMYFETVVGVRDGPVRGRPANCPFVYAQDDGGSRHRNIEEIVGMKITEFVLPSQRQIALVGRSMPPSLSGLESSSDYRLEDFTSKRK